MPVDAFEHLTLGDVQAFLAVARHGSLSGVARELRVTPSQVSKAIARLELQLRTVLLTRGGRGVALSEAGHRALPYLQEVVRKLHELRQDRLPWGELTVGAPSFLSAPLLPVMARVLPEVRLRGLELPPSLVRAYAAENFFDVTLTAGPVKLPSSWASEEVGRLRRSLYATPAVARSLGPPPVSPERLRSIPFISPLFYTNGQFVQVDDGCPLGPADRKLGHEVATIGLALELAVQTGQLVFGPAIAAMRHVERGTLVEVPVAGWAADDPLILSCNVDRVLRPVQTRLIEAMSQAITVLQGPWQKRPAWARSGPRSP